ncbi:hypothetical protein GCM10029992_35920 [Glycomyces albus]
MDESSHTLIPARSRTWGRRGRTPVIRVRKRGSGRVSLAGLTAYRPGETSRFFYRTMPHRRRKGEKPGFREREFAELLDAAHRALDAPIVLVWDNLNAHKSKLMRELIAARPWLRVFQLRPTRPNSIRSKAPGHCSSAASRAPSSKASTTSSPWSENT